MGPTRVKFASWNCDKASYFYRPSESLGVLLGNRMYVRYVTKVQVLFTHYKKFNILRGLEMYIQIQYV